MTDLELALHLCDIADDITVAAFRRVDLAVETKADQTPVTEADREVESALRRVLAERRPADAVLGEELGETPGVQAPPAAGSSAHAPPGAGSSAAGSAGRRWVIDPVDGTKNFVRRIPVWATLVALQEGPETLLGVVSAPALGRRWWASRGAGAWADGEAVRVSAVARLSDAHLSGNALSSWPGGPERYVELARRCYADRCFGDFWSHVLVAEGACDIGIDPVASLWDMAAVQVIVEEAGGRFSDLSGRARADGGSGLSTNGLLHDEVLAILSGRRS